MQSPLETLWASINEMSMEQGAHLMTAMTLTLPFHHSTPTATVWRFLITKEIETSSSISFTATRSYHSADCDTDHALVSSKVRRQSRTLHHSKTKGHPRINTAQMSVPLKVEVYVSSLNETVQGLPDCDATVKWNAMKDAIYSTAMSSFDKKEHLSQDWFNSHLPRMEPVIKAKHVAFLNPYEHTLAALRKARSTTQRIARQCANDYWQQLCNGIRCCAESGNICGMYNGTKKALGPAVKGIAPLKS